MNAAPKILPEVVYERPLRRRLSVQPESFLMPLLLLHLLLRTNSDTDSRCCTCFSCRRPRQSR